MATKKKTLQAPMPMLFEVEAIAQVKHEIQDKSSKKKAIVIITGKSGFGALYNMSEQDWSSYIANNRGNNIRNL